MKDKFCRWLAGILPDRIVMWCAIQVGAYATQGKYSKQVVPDLMFMDALKRWKCE